MFKIWGSFFLLGALDNRISCSTIQLALISGLELFPSSVFFLIWEDEFLWAQVTCFLPYFPSLQFSLSNQTEESNIFLSPLFYLVFSPEPNIVEVKQREFFFLIYFLYLKVYLNIIYFVKIEKLLLKIY